MQVRPEKKKKKKKNLSIRARPTQNFLFWQIFFFKIFLKSCKSSHFFDQNLKILAEIFWK